MSSFTPGPWTNDQFIGLSGAHHFGLNIGFTNTDSISRRDECRANAKAISAVPELIAALQLFVGENKTHTEGERIEFARAALVKALGDPA